MEAAVAPILSRFITGLDGVAHLVRDRQLLVPPFQRPYAWKEEQVQTFYWDLHAAFNSTQHEYFLGTIVLAPRAPGVSTVIDGQQRLATVTMLLAAIRDEFLRRDDVGRAAVLEADYLLGRSLRTRNVEPRLVLGRADADHFRAVVLEREDAPPELDARTDDDDDRIAIAFNFLAGRMAAEAKKAGRHWDDYLLRWVEYLDRSVRVIVVEVSDETDSFLIFETLNDRGLALTVSDLLKNHLLGLTDGNSAVAESWQTAVDALRVTADEEALATFLRHYWAARAGATRQRELFSRIRGAVETPGAALAFAEDLADAAPLYAALLDPDHEVWNTGEDVRNEIAILRTLGIEQVRPLLLACLREFTDQELTRLLRAVIGWTVRGLIVGGIGGGTTERYYGEAAAAVTDGDDRSTADVFRTLEPIIPSDDVFRREFADKRVSRIAQARYYLLALRRAEGSEPIPAVVPRADGTRVRVQAILPRRAQHREWPRFPADEPQWATRLGNLLLVPAAATGRLPTDPEPRMKRLSKHGTPLADQLKRSGVWSPDKVKRRQAEMARMAPVVWPREPS